MLPWASWDTEWLSVLPPREPQCRKRQRLRSKNLDTFSDKSRGPSESFESLVPGFSEARERMAGDAPLELEEGESVSFGEE